MKKEGFNMVGVQIEKYDEDKNELYILDYQQLLDERKFPYKFIRYSNMGYKEEIYIDIDFFKSFREEKNIPLEENEVINITHSIKYCENGEDCGGKDYSKLRAIFDKQFLYFKNEFLSNPRFIGYSNFSKNNWAGGYGKNSKLINPHKDDFIWYRWGIRDYNKYTCSISLKGESDKEIDKCKSSAKSGLI